jgi:hypothetical protein
MITARKTIREHAAIGKLRRVAHCNRIPQSPMIASNRANAGNRNAYALQSKQCRNNCGVLTKEGQQ